MNRNIARVLSLTACAVALLTAAPSFAASGTPQSTSAARPTVVDLNQASAAELVTLPGIGPSRAEAIVKYRTEKGGFSAVSELGEIKGIGDSLVKRLEPMLTVTPIKK